LRGKVPNSLCSGCGGGWEVCDRCLGGPISCSNSIDNLFGKDAVVQTKGSGRQVEVARSWRVERCLTSRPMDVSERWSRNTEGGIAEVVVGWRLGKQSTRVRFGRTANIARRTTPERVGSSVLWSDGCRVRWGCTSDN
jgi:hypothetical protein